MVVCVPDSQCLFSGYGGEFYQRNLFWFQLYNLFLWFWMMFFVIALGQMTLAGAFASYYWAWNKPKDIPMFAVTESFWRSLRFVSKLRLVPVWLYMYLIASS